MNKKNTRDIHKRRLQNRSLPSGWPSSLVASLPAEKPLENNDFNEQATKPPIKNTPSEAPPTPTPATLRSRIVSPQMVQCSPVDFSSKSQKVLRSISLCNPSTRNSFPIAPTQSRPLDRPTSVQYCQTHSKDPYSNRYFSEQCISLNSDRSQGGNLSQIISSSSFDDYASEPNLQAMNFTTRRASRDYKLTEQTISISNQRTNQRNQIILKSSFSDQNLQNSIFYEPGNDMGKISISNQNFYDPRTGLNNQTFTCIQNSQENLRNFNFPNKPKKASSSSSSSSSSGRKLPEIPFKPKDTFTLPENDDFEVSDVEPELEEILKNKKLMLKSPSEESYETLKKTQAIRSSNLSRSHSLISDDQIIDMEYDSDTGWVTRSFFRS